jgi:cell division protein FtsB
MRDNPRRPAGPRRSRSGTRQARSLRGLPGGPSRPATRRGGSPGAGAATRTSAPRPPNRMTGRAIVLGVVLVALAMSYIFPLRIYLNQQADISQLRERQVAQREHIDGLEAEAVRWTDDEYIRIQARKRLYFVAPGEVPMITVWSGETTAADRGGAEDPPERPEEWWHTLWGSVTVADHGLAPAGSDPNAPATTPDPAG